MSEHNKRILERIQGMPAQPATAGSRNDPSRPEVPINPDADVEAVARALFAQETRPLKWSWEEEIAGRPDLREYWMRSARAAMRADPGRRELEEALEKIATHGDTDREVVDPLTGEKSKTAVITPSGHLMCRSIARAALSRSRGGK